MRRCMLRLNRPRRWIITSSRRMANRSQPPPKRHFQLIRHLSHSDHQGSRTGPRLFPVRLIVRRRKLLQGRPDTDRSNPTGPFSNRRRRLIQQKPPHHLRLAKMPAVRRLKFPSGRGLPSQPNRLSGLRRKARPCGAIVRSPSSGANHLDRRWWGTPDLVNQ